MLKRSILYLMKIWRLVFPGDPPDLPPMIDTWPDRQDHSWLWRDDYKP